VEATLTELQRETAKVLGQVIHAGKSVTLTEHGQPVAKIVPRKVNRKRVLELLRGLGPDLQLPPRK
jgi:prevent-host-death family protein